MDLLKDLTTLEVAENKKEKVANFKFVLPNVPVSITNFFIYIMLCYL